MLHFRYGILHSCLAELMNKGIIAPTQAINTDCSAAEEQLLLRMSGSGTIPCSGRTAAGSARAEKLAAFVSTVTAPVVEAYGYEDVDAMPMRAARCPASEHGFPPVPPSKVAAEEQLYWADSQQSQQSVDLSLSQLQAHKDEPFTASSGLSTGMAGARMEESGDSQDSSNGSEASVSDGGQRAPARLEDRCGLSAAGRSVSVASATTSFAQDLKLTAEQYLYVVAALCEVRQAIFASPAFP
jgi:hypothetical protein